MPAGRMMMQMVGSFAEFEHAMIRERTSAGLAAARAEGRVGGRRKKLDAAHHRSQIRCGDGPALQRQPANRLAHRCRAPDFGSVADR